MFRQNLPTQHPLSEVLTCQLLRGIPLCVIFLLYLSLTTTLNAQCDPGVPAFVADLRGDPDSVWISPNVSRQDNCCGTTSPDRCIKFTVYLDPGTQGIRFDFYSGAVPSGSLFYQIGCGPSYAVGADICLSGTGPHELTFCKPGNNQNEYSITAIPSPSISPNIIVSQACVDTLAISGLVTDSITWASYPANPTYDAFLSCASGCDTTVVTPTGTFPDSISYVACGPIDGGCAGSSFCDTVTVYFVTDLAVQIQPENPTLCFGDTSTTITAHATGGLAPYKFYWSHIGGGGGAGDSVQYVDTGTYVVSLLDSLGCSYAYDTVVVTGYSDSIQAIANDTVVCRQNGEIQLNGTVEQATGGRWVGLGTFSPSDSVLNPTYTLTPSELILGSTLVQFITTGNGTCPADTDVVILTVSDNPSGALATSEDTVCQYETSIHTADPAAGDSISWTVYGGSVASSNGYNEITVLWDTIGYGYVQMYRISAYSCDTTVSDSVYVIETPIPVISGPDSACEFETVTYSLPANATQTFSWSTNGGSIVGSSTSNTVDVFWNSYGTGIVTVTVTNANGCDSTVNDSILIVQKPTPSISGPDSACHNNVYTYTVTNIAGNTYSWGVSNGTLLSGQSTNSATILWGIEGTGVVSLTQTSAFGCDSTVYDTIEILYTPAPVITGPDTVCSNKITTHAVTSVAGDSYSWNVTNGTITSGQGTNSIDIFWGGIGSGVISVTQTSADGCDSTITDTVTVVYTPAPVISGPDSACENNITSYTVPNVAGDSYSWNVTNGTIISGQGTTSISILWDTADVGTISVTQTSPFGCDSAVSKSVTVLYTPVPKLKGTDTACRNKEFVFAVDTASGDSYNWVVTNGTITSGQGTSRIIAIFDTVGTGTVTLTQTSGLGCDSTISDTILVVYTPAPVISGDDSTCHNNIYTYTTASVAGDSYNWSVNNGTILSGQGTNSIDILWGTQGVGSVSITQTSPLGCDSTVLDSIVILYTPAPVITGEDSTCYNNIYTYTTPSVAGDSYSWSVNNGTIIIGQGTNSIDILWGTQGVGTVSITQTSPLGCDSTVLDSIVILYTPVPVISGDDSTCHNNIYTYTTPSVAGDSYSWSVNNGTILSGQGTNSIDILWGTQGVGTVSITQTSPLGCDSTITDSIVILYTPAPVITGDDSTCHNNIYTYTTPSVAGDSYSWAVNNGTILSGQGTNSIDILWGTQGVGTVSITQTSPLGCDSTVLDSIVILYTPAPAITGDDSTCHNNIYTYTTASVAGDSYSWSVNNGTILSGQGTNSIDILWGTQGVGTVSITQTSPLGCDSTVLDSIVILYTPAPVITGDDSTCHNNIYTYTTASVVGDSYSWSVNNGTILSGQGTNSIDILWGTQGVGTVSITQTSPLGCDSTVLDSIVILYTPAPVISGDDSTCHNNIYTYTTASVAGDSYSWSVNNGTILSGQGTNSIDILWGAQGVGTVSITQTSPLGCDSTVLDSIVILYTPAPVISGEDSTCHNNIYTYTTASVAGDSYSWSVNNGTILSGQGTNSIDILWGTQGVGTVSITQTSPLGCDSTVLDSIVILYTPAPVISGDDSTCHNNIYTYTTPSVAGDSYSWSVNNGTIISGQGTNSVDILWGTQGVGTVSITQTSPLGCDSTVLDSIVILYTPAPVITGDDSTCHNNIYTYTTPSVAGDTYSWSVNNGTILSGQGTNSIDILWGAQGVGTVSITQTSPLGCDSTITDSIVILYTPAPVITGEDSTCHNNIYTYTTPSVAGDSYSWSVNNGTILSGQGTNSVDILWGTQGVGTVSITQTSPLGCDSTVLDSIVILYTPAPVITGDDSTCHNNIYTYTTASVAGDSYSWTVNNGTILSGQGTNSIDILWGTQGVGTVSITQTSPLGCDSTVLDSIVILYTPAPVITGDDSTCHNNIYTYTTASVAGDSYSWSVNNGTILSGQGTNSIDILWGTQGVGTVSITQTSPLGCDSTVLDSIVILYTPAPVLTGPDTTCHNDIQTHSVPSVAGDSYSWTVTGGTIISGQGTNAIDVLWSSTGIGTVVVTQTSPLGCDSTVADSIIVVLYTPIPVISGIDSVCDNNIYTYSTPSIAGDTYSWTVVGGTILSGQNTNSIDVVWNGVGSGSITIYQVSPLGCDSTVVLPVQILYTPAPVITGPDSACQNKIYTYTTPSVAGDSYTWSVTNGTIVAGQGTNSIDVMLDTIGTSIVSITQASPLGCDSTITDTIDVIYTPAPVLTGNDTVCHNKIYTYSVPLIVGDTFSWTATNGTIIAGQGTNSVDVLWGTAGSGSISVTQTSPLGCDSTLSATITILYTPAPVIAGADSACQNKIYTYSIPSVAGDTYTWAVTNGTIIAGQGTNSIDVMLDTIGTSVVSITQASPLGCDSTITDTIDVIYTPSPVLTGNDTVCHNKIYTYSVANIAGDSYNWSVSNGTIVSGQSTNTVDVLWGTAGSGSITLTQTSPLGCDSTLIANITILYTPAPVLTGNDTVCHNKIYTYSVPNVGGDSYNWTVSNGTIVTGQSTNTVDILWGTASSGSISVTQTSSLGCDSTVSAAITILYTPAPVIAGSDSACQNKIYTYSIPSIAGDTYTWSVTNGTIVAGQGTNSIDVMLDTIGTSVVSITQTSPLGCDSTITDTIDVIYTPAPVLTGNDTVCHNKIYTYSVPLIAGDTFSWTVTNGTIISGQGTNSVDVLWGTAGGGSISVTQTSPLGCDSTLSATITILYTPAPVISGEDSACHNKIYTYTTPSIAGDNYNWSVNNGTIVAGQGTNSIDILWGTQGVGTVSVTQTSPLSCDSTVLDSIVILYTPAPVISGEDSTCHNKIYSYTTPSIAGDTYNWTVSNGTIVAGQGTNSIDILWGTQGVGTVSVTQTSPLGCDSTVLDSIVILYTPAPIITGPDSACQNKIYTYTTPSVAGDSYTWSVTNGTIIAGQGTNSIDVMLDTIGTSVVSITQTSPLGCDSTITDTINVIYTPVPVLAGNDTVCHNKIYTYSVANIAGDSYNWSVSNGTIIAGQSTNTVDVLWGIAGSGSITVTQTSPLGCDSTLSAAITILYTPAPVITGPDSTCHNNIYTYSTPSIAGDNYNWTVSNGTIIAGQGTNSIDILWGTQGLGTVAVTQTSPLSCDSTVSDSIVILYTPAPVITGPDSACQNKIYTYTTPSVAGDSYTWSVTNGTIIAGQGTNSIDVMLDTIGISIVSITQTSPLGCDSTITDTIDVIYTPAPVLTGNDTVCHNKIYTYSVPLIVGDTFSWTAANGTIIAGQGTNSVDVLWGTAGSGSISVTQTSPLGCDSTLSAAITILYTPAPIISGPDSACQNKIYTYSIPSVAGDTYTWNVTNGTIIAGQGTNSIDVMLDTIGSSVVSITQASPLGCDSTITDTIDVIYTPAPVLTGNDTVCHNKIYTYSVPLIVGDTFSWAATNGTIIAGQGTNSVDVLWGTAGSGSISVTQTSPLGCDSTLSAAITILYTPAPVIAGPDSACQNKIYTYSIPSIAGDTYTWNVTNGTIIAGQGTNSIDVMLDTIGISVVSITQASPLGCDSTITDTIDVIYTPAPVLTGNDTVCHNKIYTYSVANIAGDSYNWSVSNGTIVSGQSTNTVDVLWGTAGSGSITITQTSPLGCDSTLTANITILYTPAPVIVGADSACHNKPYSYLVPNVSSDTYNWTITNGTIVGGQGTSIVTVLWDTVGTGTISLTQTSPLGCDSTISRTIDILYTPNPLISGADTACHNKIYTYNVPVNGSDTYTWVVTNGTIVAGQNTNSVDVLWGTVGTGTIGVTQTSDLGCDSSLVDTVVIIYTPAPVITGPDSVCHNNIYTYSVPSVANDTFSWTVSNGTIVAGQGTNSVDVLWGTMGSGSISILQTSPQGCDSLITFPVQILYTPAPVIAGPDSACQNKIYTYTTPSIAGDSYVWAVTNGTIIAGQGTNSIDVMLDTIGTSVVSITQTSPLGCDSTISDTIDVIYTPAPVLTGNDSVCHNKIYTYSVPQVVGDTFSWSATNGTIISGQGTNSVDVLWGTAGSGSINVTQTSPLGCDSTLSAAITILYTPAPVIAGPDSACHNKIYTYSVPSVGGDSYNWSITNGTIISGQNTNSITVAFDTVGFGTVAILQTSSLGCDSLISDTVKVIYTPAPIITGPDTTCHNKIQTYSVPVVGNDTYSWSVTNGTIVAGQNTNTVDILWGTTGTGSLFVTQTSTSGCDSTVGYSIVVIQYTPVPVIVGTDSACHNKPYNYLAPNVSNDTYNWTVTNGTITAGQGTNILTVVWDTVGTGTITLTQTSPQGCDSTVSRTIDILYTPNPLISGADTACHNKIYTYSVPVNGSDTYNWVVTNGTIVAGQNTNSVDVLWGAVGMGTIGITQTSNVGCDSSVVDTITIIYSPAPVVTGPDSVCHNNIYTYSVPSVANDTFSWSVINGTIISGQGTNTVDVLWGTAGSASISILQTSPQGCDSLITFPVQILYTPVPVIAGPDSACQNKIYTYSTPSVAGDGYNWIVTNGTIVAGQGTNSIDVMLDTVGSSVISVTQTSPLGCDSTITDTVDVVYTPAPVLTGNDSVCHNNIYTYSVPQVVGDTFSWTTTNGTIIAGQGTNSVDVLWGTAGSGSISVTQISPLGCDSTLTANITVLYNPAPVITGPDSTCQNKIYTYSTPVNGSDSYTWTITNGTIIAGQGTNSIDVMLDTIGSSVVSITQTSSLGCDSTVTDTIRVIYTPAPIIAGDDTVCHNKIHSYSVPVVGSDTYSWSVTNGTIIAGQNTNAVDVLWGTAGSGTISVTQTSPSGCDSTLTANITILHTPAPIMAGADSACHNKPYNYLAPNVSSDTYNWAITNGTIVGGQGTSIVTVLWDTVGTGTISLTQTSPLGCDSTISRTIDILYTPNPLISGDDTACHNKIYTYSVPVNGSDSYNWSVTNGTIIAGQNTNMVDVLWGSAGIGTIGVTQTSNIGCDSTLVDTVTILYSPAPDIAGNDSACFSSIHTYSVQNIVGDTFTWVVTGGTIISGQGTDSIEILWDASGSGNIVVTQTSPYGCDSTVSLPVQLLYMPTPAIVGLDTVCHNKIYNYQVPFVVGDIYNWLVTNGSIVAGQGTNSIDIMWGAPGIGTVTLTQTSNLGCDTTVTDTATILYSPNPQIQGNDTVCFNQVHTYHVDSVGLDTYNWVVSGGTIINGQGTDTITVQWTTVGNGFVRITQTSPQGCDSVMTLPVNVRYRPTPQVSGTTLVCSNKIITYSTPNVVGDSYVWTATNGTIIAGQGTNTVDVMWNLTDTGYIYVRQISPLSCDSVALDTITIRPTPAPVIAGDDTVCHNKIGYYSVDTLHNHTYTWSVTGGTILNGQSTEEIAVLWGAAGNGRVEVIQTSDLGCDSSMFVDVLIHPSPSPVISSPDTVCHNKIYTHLVTGVAGNTYLWRVTNGAIVSDSVNNTVSIMWGAPGKGYLEILQTNAQGCDSLVRDSVIIVGSPNPQITGPDSVCHNKITSYTVSPAPVTDTYQWTVANGTILNGQGTPTISVIWGVAGTPASVSIMQTDQYGCDSIKTKPIHIDPTPAPIIQGNINICSENFEYYSITPQAGHTYSWSVTGGALMSPVDSVAARVNWGAPGAGTVTITQTNPFGCDSSYTLPVTIRRGPIRHVAGPDTVCENTAYNYQATTPEAGDIYLWTVTGGTIQGANNAAQVNVLWNTVGVQRVRLAITNSFGCDSVFEMAVNVFDLPAPDLRGDDKACANSKNNLFKDYEYNSTQAGNLKYAWGVSGGGTITTDTDKDSILIDWTGVGSHTVTLSIEDLTSGCIATQTLVVRVDSLHEPEILASGLSGCAPMNVKFTEKENSDLLSYQWLIDGLGFRTEKEPEITYYKEGTYNARVIVTNDVGCVDTATLQVIVRPSPVADFIINKDELVYEEDTAYFTNTSTGAIKYKWIFHDSTTDSSVNTYKYYTWPGKYPVQLVAINEYGCPDTTEKLVNVVVKPIIYVPNAITPNGDFNNDYFEVSTYFVSELKIIIFNRWGEIIFRSEDVDFKWDAIYKGVPVQQDVYAYYIVARGFNHELIIRTGNVTVLR